MPAVSTIVYKSSLKFNFESMESLVVPGVESTIDFESPIIALNIVDLPTLGLPTIENFIDSSSSFFQKTNDN